MFCHRTALRDMEEVKQFMRLINIPTEGNNLLEKLRELGVESLEDLKEIRPLDLEKHKTGLTVIAQRKLIRHIKESTLVLPASPDSPPLQPRPPVPRSLEECSIRSNRQPPMHAGQKIYYIFCKNLFKRNVPQQVVSNLSLETDPLELVIKIIAERHKCSLQTYALELYSQEGYPLCVNEYNEKFTLLQWKIENESMFYVFVRPHDQPAWRNNELSNDDLSDPAKGSQRVKIYSQLYRTFQINCDLQTADVDTLKSKVSKYTGLPLQVVNLYKLANGYGKLRQGSELDVCNNDVLVLRIEGFYPETILEKKLYVPTQLQTDRGIAKFYTILKYLISSPTEDYQKFVSAILKFSCCPPLAYAFDQLFQHKSIVSLSHIVVLFEGFLQLSQAVLDFFCSDVLEDNCLEFCDYIFGLLLKFAKDTKDTSKVKTEKISLQCPISDRQILRPIRVPESDAVYEWISAEKKIKSNLGLVDCTCESLELGDIRPAEDYERLLMFKAFFDSGNTSDADFNIWKNNMAAQKEIPPILISCTWKELNDAISLLEIKSPDALAATTYCITYIGKGQFALYTEPVKTIDNQFHVYDPIIGNETMYRKDQMTRFASDFKEKACHKLTDYLNPKIKSNLRVSEVKSSSAIGQKPDISEIKKVPNEAIMVLVDCSGSMSENIFERGSSHFSRLSSAIELFYAFANRCDAYGFNHAIGLITFASDVSVKVEFTQIMDYFKETLSKMKCGGQTALHSALAEAADKLGKFTKKYPTCHKRILCLTDGEDNRSKITAPDITRRLQREKIVVDTVLITRSGNIHQKAISHATGGFCFLPSTFQEAIRLFEMEILLRLEERSIPFPKRQLVSSKRDMEIFEDLTAYPYDPTNPYEFTDKTNFAADMEQFDSSSAKKMVTLASFMGQSSTGAVKVDEDCVRRIILEAKNYIRNPHSSVEIFPGKTNVMKWKVLLKGPDDCPYEGGVFLLLAKFPSEYPSKAPEIRFVTPIYHCNINSSGRICHPILGRNYVPRMTIRSIIDHIYGLLMAPEPLDPLDSVLASQYHDSRAVYEARAAELTEKYAKKIGWSEMRKELTEDEDTDIAEGLVCPLTNKLFTDPVLTPHGFTYERSTLLEYMRNNGNRDPKAHKQIRVQDLIPQRNIKQLAESFRQMNLLK